MTVTAWENRIVSVLLFVFLFCCLFIPVESQVEARVIDRGGIILVNPLRKPTVVRNSDGTRALALPLHPRFMRKSEVSETNLERRLWAKNFGFSDIPRKSLKSLNMSSAVAPKHLQRYYEEYLHGGVFTKGEYYLELVFGGSRYYIQLDTGSSNLIVNTNKCTSCNSASSIAYSQFSPISCSSNECSQSYCAPSPENSACGFSITYGSGNVKGALLQGNVGIANLTAKNIVFGGIIEESSDFEPTSVSGLLGMAYPSLSCQPTCVSPLLDYLYDQNLISYKIFTVLLNSKDGVLVLGGAGDFEIDESNKTPILQQNCSVFYFLTNSSLSDASENTYYIVGLERISIGPAEVWSSSSAKEAIVDTGTTLLYVDSTMFSDIVSFFEKFSSTNSDYWSKLKSNPSYAGSFSSVTFPKSSTYINSLGNISFYLSNNVSLQVSSNEYIQCESQKCAFMIGQGPSSFPSIIFGDLILQNYYTIFDQKSSSIIFGPAPAVSSLNLIDMPGVGDISVSGNGSSNSSHTIPTYGIVLIVVGAVAVAGLIGLFVALMVRRKRKFRLLEGPQMPLENEICQFSGACSAIRAKNDMMISMRDTKGPSGHNFSRHTICLLEGIKAT
eukprot:jgi/Galph1/425/GphlegSOOS_G5255.1